MLPLDSLQNTSISSDIRQNKAFLALHILDPGGSLLSLGCFVLCVFSVLVQKSCQSCALNTSFCFLFGSIIMQETVKSLSRLAKKNLKSFILEYCRGHFLMLYLYFLYLIYFSSLSIYICIYIYRYIYLPIFLLCFVLFW